MRQQLAGHEPRDDGEPEDLGDDDGHLHRVEAAAVLVRREALADGEAYDEEGDQLDDDDGGEYLHADGLAQPALVDERLRDDAQAGEGEHACEAEGLREAEAQLEVEEVIGRDCEGDQHRERHGEHGGEEDPAADGGDEAADVQLLHPDEEEEHEDADAENEFDLRAGVDEAGDGAEDHAGDGVCEDGVQAKALEDALEELGGDDERANRKESFVDLHPVVLPVIPVV